MRAAAKVFLLVLLVSVVASARKRDPLTEAETDQLREVAMEPYKRLKLLIKFTEARLVAIDQVRVDPKLAKDRGKQIHDLLEDFTSLLDEINDNLDQYEARTMNKDDQKDFKKGLKELIEADERFDLKLRTLQSAAETDPQTKKELPDFRFVLQDAQEALKSNAEMAREYIDTTHEEKKK
jgi:endonuclease III